MSAPAVPVKSERSDIEGMRKEIDEATEHAANLCRDATTQAVEMDKYVKLSADFHSMVTILDQEIKQGASTMSDWNKMQQKLIDKQPEHKTKMDVLHTKLLELATKQKIISKSGQSVASDLVILHTQTEKAYETRDKGKDFNHKSKTNKADSEHKAVTQQIYDKHSVSDSKKVEVNKAFLMKVQAFVGEVQRLVTGQEGYVGILEKMDKTLVSINSDLSKFSADNNLGDLGAGKNVKDGKDGFEPSGKVPTAKNGVSNPNIDEKSPEGSEYGPLNKVENSIVKPVQHPPRTSLHTAGGPVQGPHNRGNI